MTKYLTSALFIMLCALIIRGGAIWSSFYSPDELMHISISQGASLTEVLGRSTAEVHPPLEHIFKWFILGATDHPIALRMLYCAIGIAAMITLGLAAQAVGGSKAGLICLAFASFMPAAIGSSILVRGYGIFLLTASLAVREFLSLTQANPESDSRRYWRLGLWLVLACATNFSGFLLAGALIISLLPSILRTKKIRSMIAVISITACIAMEGAMLFWWYFSPGTGAWEWRILSRSPVFETCSQFSSVHIFALRLINIFCPLTSALLSPELVVGLGAATLTLYLFGLAVIARRQPAVALFAIVQWAIALIMNFSDLYPIVGPRHSIYLFPAIIIPLALLLAPAISKRIVCITVFILTLSSVWIDETAPQSSADFPLTTRNYLAAKEYIKQEISPHETILTSRFGLLYALYEKDKLKTFYQPSEPIFGTSFEGHKMVAFTRDRLWQMTRDDLSALLRATSQHGHNSDETIWLLSFGFQDNTIEQIKRCAATANLKMKGMHAPGVSITGLARVDLEKLANPNEDCLRSYVDNLCAAPI